MSNASTREQTQRREPQKQGEKESDKGKQEIDFFRTQDQKTYFN